MARQDKRPRLSAYDQAVKLLATRDHSERELRRKLMQRQYDPSEIDDAIAATFEDRYLDDDRTAARWAEQEARKGGQGRAKALARLIQHGINPDLARQALDEVWDDELEREHGREVLAKLLRSLSPEQRRGRDGQARLARRLASRGFSPDIIRELLRELPPEPDPPFPGTESDG